MCQEGSLPPTGCVGYPATSLCQPSLSFLVWSCAQVGVAVECGYGWRMCYCLSVTVAEVTCMLWLGSSATDAAATCLLSCVFGCSRVSPPTRQAAAVGCCNSRMSTEGCDVTCLVTYVNFDQGIHSFPLILTRCQLSGSWGLALFLFTLQVVSPLAPFPFV